jgi:pimeloyl-ACP methyl ester carboxylesterase
MSDTPRDSYPRPMSLAREDGTTTAYHRFVNANGRNLPGVVFLGGFASDMTGTKAVFLESYCRNRGQPFIRFDYFGHGASSGRFSEGTIGRWREDALTVIDRLTEGPQILVGSSMGGWIMLLTALQRPDRIAGLVGIAAAPDFTEELMWNRMTAPIKEQLLRTGEWHEPSRYGPDLPITLKLIEEGRHHLLLGQPIAVDCPVRLLQGMEDPEVPWRWAVRIAEHLTSRDVAVTLVKDGDHRLSRPQDLARLAAVIDEMSAQASIPRAAP